MPDRPINGAEERLVKRVIARFRCSHCNRQHIPENVNVMGTYDDEDVWIIGVRCDGCDNPSMFVVSLRKDSTLDSVTDLTDAEQERFLAASSVDSKDVEAVRAFLRDFKGNFSSIFGRAESD